MLFLCVLVKSDVVRKSVPTEFYLLRSALYQIVQGSQLKLVANIQILQFSSSCVPSKYGCLSNFIESVNLGCINV